MGGAPNFRLRQADSPMSDSREYAIYNAYTRWAVSMGGQTITLCMGPLSRDYGKSCMSAWLSSLHTWRPELNMILMNTLAIC